MIPKRTNQKQTDTKQPNNGRSFVSVHAAASNTTNSMGRLTSNVLLSFAQSGEVIGERLRQARRLETEGDGAWAGATARLQAAETGARSGYSESEAEIVRLDFSPYANSALSGC